ncbi:MAG: hypothetical protein RBG13Loki_2616 [Promethearchaeota archaeon CR_4]|nr:MAG: hypothetical protein RBG13Loki_2616 [Candidatus Lokiarchaeota archaeon CR_4]
MRIEETHLDGTIIREGKHVNVAVIRRFPHHHAIEGFLIVTIKVRDIVILVGRTHLSFIIVQANRPGALFREDLQLCLLFYDDSPYRHLFDERGVYRQGNQVRHECT